MSNEVYVYVIDLPPGIHEMIAPCLGGFTVYLDAKDTAERRKAAYAHAMKHIARNDHYSGKSVNEIETLAHKNTPQPPNDD